MNDDDSYMVGVCSISNDDILLITLSRNHGWIFFQVLSASFGCIFGLFFTFIVIFSPFFFFLSKNEDFFTEEYGPVVWIPNIKYLITNYS